MDEDPTPDLGVEVIVATDHFDADFDALITDFGFRVEAIFPADDPSTAVISRSGMCVRLVESTEARPVQLIIRDDSRLTSTTLPGGSEIIIETPTPRFVLPDNDASVVLTPPGGEAGEGRAGMRYTDLIPDRWGGRFISSLISIPDGGSVADYVHFHKIRFQLIFVKSGWVRVVYEDQGDPFVMHRGDAVVQPPEIRHQVLEASHGLEVIEIGTPAKHETIADWSLTLPNGVGDPRRSWSGQHFVHHVAADAAYGPWRLDGWECRDSGIGAATDGLAGVRVARPLTATARQDGGSARTSAAIRHDSEFTQLVVLAGTVSLSIDGAASQVLVDGASVAIPGGVSYALNTPSADCELLDVTLPAAVELLPR